MMNPTSRGARGGNPHASAWSGETPQPEIDEAARKAKLDSLQARIKEGSYRIDSEELAATLMKRLQKPALRKPK